MSSLAVIPAAGMATRLRPLTDNKPKCLLEVGGSTLLARALTALRSNGIDEAVIVTGYLSGMIEDYVRTHFADMTVHFVHNPRYESTNNIYSLYLAAPFAAGREILLLDSDILFDPLIIERLMADPATEILALDRHTLGDEEIKVLLDNDGYVCEISKTVDPRKAAGESIGIEKMGAVYSGLLYDTLRDMIEVQGLDNVFYEQAFERLIAQGHKFRVADISGLTAMELDTVEDFEAASKSTAHG